MATNIVNAAANPVGGNAWGTVGSGLQGLGQMLSAAWAAKDAADKAKAAQPGAAVPVPKPIDMTNTGLPAPGPMGADVLGDPAAGLAKLTAMAPPPPSPFGGSNDMGFKLGRDVGLPGVFAQRFPNLFPQASRNLTQYGGL